MAKGFRSIGVDFDDLFDPDVVGDGPSVANLRSGGAPLKYAHIQYGSKRADVGYRQSGVDVSNLWAAKGTASYSLPFNGQTFNSSNAAASNSSGNASAGIILTIASNGTYEIRATQTGGGHSANVQVASGSWLPSGGNVSDYDVQFEASNVGLATVSNGSPTYSSCTTSRSITTTMTVIAASADSRLQTVTIVCRLRKAGGGTSVTTMYAEVSAFGWL